MFSRALQSVLAVIAVPCIGTAVVLSVSFYWLGSLTPDPASGRTYPVQMHGTMYVTPLLGQIHITLFFVGVVCFAAFVVVSLWRQHYDGSP